MTSGSSRSAVQRSRTSNDGGALGCTHDRNPVRRPSRSASCSAQTRGNQVTSTARTQLKADTRAPALARAFVTDEIDDAELRGDVVLVVSELVTNAVRAGSTSIDVILTTDAQGLELIVEDDAAGVPQPREATPESLGGRGLGIVEKLADSWRTTEHAGRRKQVTARWNAR
ncbi:MAG: ATP-binding protein [Microbacterium sp.]|nr:MAG: ATP-binding protein [Microbacterium sp.]